MWIAKGFLLGVWVFSFGWLFSIVRLYLIGKKLSGGRGPGILGIEVLLPVSNPSFWLWMVVCLALGLSAARSFSIKPVVWITMAVTELVPAGLLAFILVVVGRMKEMVK